METLPFPKDIGGNAFCPRKVYELCISKVRKIADRKRLKSLARRIATASVEYDAAAAGTTLHTFSAYHAVGQQYKKDLTRTYESRMVDKKQPGRSVYDCILRNAPNRICPLCGLGAAKTLDHHLPKSRYPVFAVLPNNLIPACYWCQGSKGETFPKTAAEETLHPYFDRFDNDHWLQARVIEVTPTAFQFFVSAPRQWGRVIVARLTRHLSVFQLGDLYSRNAASEVSGIEHYLGKLLVDAGKAAVSDHLKEQSETWSAHRKNHWKAAMYRAAAASEWFCDGGFRSV